MQPFFPPSEMFYCNNSALSLPNEATAINWMPEPELISWSSSKKPAKPHSAVISLRFSLRICFHGTGQSTEMLSSVFSEIYL